MNQPNRRSFIQTTGVVSLFSIVSSRHLMAQTKPNVLWIIGEDVSPDIGCYGNKVVHTPHIDKLAGEGVRFDQAFATCPVCSPARSALHSGMYQTSIGAHNHRSHRDDNYRLPEGTHLVTHLFQQAGYQTANIKTFDGKLKGAGKTDWNFNVDHHFDTDTWDDLKPEKPFFAQINFPESHRTFKRSQTNPVSVDDVEIPPYYPDHEIFREDWAAYLDTVGMLDEKVGAVLKKLEADGLADNTVVVFMGDHGRCMPRGKQFLYEGGIRIPLIVRYPDGYQANTVNTDLVQSIDVTATTLNIAGIDLPEAMQGQSFLDPNTQKRDAVFSARDRCDETVDWMRCVRNKRFKLIRNYYTDRPYTQLNRYKETSYPGLRLMRRMKHEGKLNHAQSHFMADSRPEYELYDLRIDPHEINNVAYERDYQNTLKKLQTKLDEWIASSGDMGHVKEDPAVHKQFENQMKNVYDERLKKLYEDEGMDLDWIGIA